MGISTISSREFDHDAGGAKISSDFYQINNLIYVLMNSHLLPDVFILQL